MSLSFSIAEVSEIIPLRHQVLRVGKPIETANFQGDDLEDTLHFGAKLDNRIVGCVSFMKVGNSNFDRMFSYQLRGMAVSNEHRGMKIGAQLIAYAENYLKSLNVDFIWCNVRESAISFYKKQNYKTFGENFVIKDIGPHIVMYKDI